MNLKFLASMAVVASAALSPFAGITSGQLPATPSDLPTEPLIAPTAPVFAQWVIDYTYPKTAPGTVAMPTTRLSGTSRITQTVVTKTGDIRLEKDIFENGNTCEQWARERMRR